MTIKYSTRYSPDNDTLRVVHVDPQRTGRPACTKFMSDYDVGRHLRRIGYSDKEILKLIRPIKNSPNGDTHEHSCMPITVRSKIDESIAVSIPLVSVLPKEEPFRGGIEFQPKILRRQGLVNDRSPSQEAEKSALRKRLFLEMYSEMHIDHFGRPWLLPGPAFLSPLRALIELDRTH